MQAIVLAGGLGTRLRGVVPDLPKPMAAHGWGKGRRCDGAESWLDYGWGIMRLAFLRILAFRQRTA